MALIVFTTETQRTQRIYYSLRDGPKCAGVLSSVVLSSGIQCRGAENAEVIISLRERLRVAGVLSSVVLSSGI